VAVKQSDDTAWQDADWKDSTAADYVEQQSWRIHTALWQIAGLKVGADTIDAGRGDDLVWGDSLALAGTTVARGAGVTDADWKDSSGDAGDAIERFAVLTDSADYWLALRVLDNGDDIAGGDGNDIPYGQAGNDRIRGEAGDDYLIGGDGDNDSLDGGLGTNKKTDGNDNSSTLRAAVAARLINWKDTFKNFGVPFAPFGGKTPETGNRAKPSSFDFLDING